jgi:hypothetical protein
VAALLLCATGHAFYEAECPILFTCNTGHSRQLRTQGTVAMLSDEAVRFLTSRFHRHAHNGLVPLSLLLEDSGPESMFHNAPPSIDAQARMRKVTRDVMFPICQSSKTAAPGSAKGTPASLQGLARSADEVAVALDVYLCIWAFCTMTDARGTLAAMLYMGFPDTYDRCGPSHMKLSGAI